MSSIPFLHRHLGCSLNKAQELAQFLGYDSLDALVDAAVPASIRSSLPMDLPGAATEVEALAELSQIMGKNKILRSFIGQGYYGTHTPPVIQRNILENPGWYTAYTPYQAEIAQGRMEAIMNFQTMVTELTGLPVSNASLLDEGTAVAEAASLALTSSRVAKPKQILVHDQCLPQSIAVLKTRMEPLGLQVVVGNPDTISIKPDQDGTFAIVIQYPAADGSIQCWKDRIAAYQSQGCQVIMATDLLALTLLKPPGELGADIAVGSSQRFGIPFGFGGPHAGFIAVKDELKRKLPGRIVGLSIDAQGKPAYRLSLQTREQHIRREKATSNICTAQVLLAVMAGMYAVYHGPEGLKQIARHVHSCAGKLADALTAVGYTITNKQFFDTLTLAVPGNAADWAQKAAAAGYNLRVIDADHLGISCDETTTDGDLAKLSEVFGCTLANSTTESISPSLLRTSAFLQQEVYQRYHTEHEMLRYMARLEKRDLALNESMISLGSCTMKLNATAEMMPLSWPQVGTIHPLTPRDQVSGYLEMISQLEKWLCQTTGFAACSLQPNAGSQGEYAGLLAIRSWHRSRGDLNRNICLIPSSAHGTNPASAVMVGMKVVPVACDDLGNIDVTDLKKKAADHAVNLAALMVTYPSTHGVFEETIRDICQTTHDHGGQVYMDGANMNAQVGLTSPGEIGADVCHLNLHKTFCIPHGGGGPGVGPICVAAHLAPHLPGTDLDFATGSQVSAAPFGSASILTISWMYIRMMGSEGLTLATKIAILNANYVAKRLHEAFPVLYRGKSGLVAHECIIDLRKYKDSAGVSVEDVAKRLMDYGYHSPTMSWPVPGTLMIEPTESESPAELDRFCDAMLGIHREILAIESGAMTVENSPLRHAPHTADVLLAAAWDRPYSRESAAFPDTRLKQHKYWPPVSRVDNVHGDKHLICTCDPVSAYGS
jgi:glycine dehydrogenase